MKVLIFEAIIPEHSAEIAFTLQELVDPLSPFSIRGLVIPWLREGNVPKLIRAEE